MMSSGKDYKSTLNLPKTDFPMKASLPLKEPEQVQKWDQLGKYCRMVEMRSTKPAFVFHDGPPYANGNIHIGHALNKILKDIAVKYKNMSGFYTAFIPGWDCHGLPVELGVEKKLRDEKKDKRELSRSQLRDLCRAYAQSYIERQKLQFKRLGVLADWNHPYTTMSDEYVASIIREVGRFSKAGNLFKGTKPVYWCPTCATALADAEIEYYDHTDPSLYVKFYIQEHSLKKAHTLSKFASGKRVALVIWTTTPWTLPANLGIALHPSYQYAALDVGSEILVVADGLVEQFLKETEISATKIGVFSSVELEKKHAEHPFMQRTSLIMLGEHVTLDAGTGAVHTAPGHGMDDYQLGLKYGLEPFSPVNEHGKITDEVPQYKGLQVFTANQNIIDDLQASGHLVKGKTIVHSYPHCWRCHKPVIYRATPQWFISMEKTNLRARCIEEIRKVEWIPAWGINRILGMVESRPDWCVSRQRVWGVPITVFYCIDCGEPTNSQESFDFVADIIEKNGSNAWYDWPTEKLFKPGQKCKCGQVDPKKFRKETDILDVWFDSGVSHVAAKVRWPADLYLEGSDQHRGWFQTSLLTSVETRGAAPYRHVLTHGFVNDKEGKKMSKSKGNVTDPIEFSEKYGAEILRLWVVLEDYRNDVNFSLETIDRVSESYRKIRNTFRYILGNLYDFDSSMDPGDSSFCELDQWALSRTQGFLERLKQSYESFEYHLAYHALVNFCAVDLSAVYFDVLKDRLYTLRANSKERRSSQAALYRIGSALVRGLAPILSFTSEEVWKALTKKESSVFEEDFPEWKGASHWEESAQKISQVLNYRDLVNKELEVARAAKSIGHSLEAQVELIGSSATLAPLKAVSEDLARLFIVSKIKFTDNPSAKMLAINVEQASGSKCARCWVFSDAVGKNVAEPLLCERCIDAVHGAKGK